MLALILLLLLAIGTAILGITLDACYTRCLGYSLLGPMKGGESERG